MIKLKYRPVRGPTVISSRYGVRVLGGLEFHPGIDYKAPLGEPIYCVDNGKVAVAWNDPSGYGLYVVVEHSGYCTLYAHLREHILYTGQNIKAGELVGYVGMTGMTTGPHLHFEIRDCLYSNSSFWLKSNLKGRHVMCIDPEALVKEADEVSKAAIVEYKKYATATELKGNPLDINSAIVNKRIWDITEFTNCTNGPFFYPDGKGKMYATSIFYDNGKVYQTVANHYYNFGCPQSVFIIYKDGTVDMKRINFLTELDLGKVQFAVGGVGLRNTQDKIFKYSPVTEGFKAGYRLQDGKYADYTDVLRKANKTVIGYNKKQNKVYLLTAKSIAHGALIDYISQGDESYDIAVSLDGGGSSFMDALGNYVFEGEKNRVIHSIVGFNL